LFREETSLVSVSVSSMQTSYCTRCSSQASRCIGFQHRTVLRPSRISHAPFRDVARAQTGTSAMAPLSPNSFLISARVWCGDRERAGSRLSSRTRIQAGWIGLPHPRLICGRPLDISALPLISNPCALDLNSRQQRCCFCASMITRRSSAHFEPHPPPLSFPLLSSSDLFHLPSLVSSLPTNL
jgi:hypothetical protein